MGEDVDGPATAFDYCLVNDSGALRVDLNFWISQPLSSAPTFALEQTGAAASLSRKWNATGVKAGGTWHIAEKVNIGPEILKVIHLLTGSDQGRVGPLPAATRNLT